jgi:pectinesterase
MKQITTFVSSACAIVLAAIPASAQNNSATHKIKIVLVGDSTVTDGAGWGLGFKQFLNPNMTELINTAQGGRSSMSFINEGRWTNALALKADYYLIQFGHNNQPGKPGRSTDMPTYESNLVQYVEDARAIGAKPVLVTPLTRRQWQKDNSGKINPGLQPWADVVKKVAAEKNVPVVDLHARSIELCESYGPKGCEFFCPVKGTNANGKLTYDGTHLNSKGWVMFARLVANELRKNAPELAPYLLDKPLSEQPTSNDAKYNAVVSFDGSGTHTNIQSAIDAVPDHGTNWFTILVKPGVYEGQVFIPKTKRHIRILGEDGENTVLTWPYNVFDRSVTNKVQFDPGLVINADDVHVENLTIENTSGDHGQALAIMVNGDRNIFSHCRIVAWQDTLMVNNGRDYFTNCYVAGRVDFIYGSAAAVFDHCEIHSRNGGHVTAASTPEEKQFGFVFLDCRLTGDPAPWMNPTNVAPATNSAKNGMADLGRPWRSYASVAYVRCEMGDHIKPEGWNNWRNPTNDITARFVEFNSTGPGANPAARVKWSRQLTEAEAGALTAEKVLRGSDDWKPSVGKLD